MQITATLSGSTATIATNNCGISTSMSVTDAANLATDLAAFTDPDAPSVDATSFTTSGKGPSSGQIYHWGPNSIDLSDYRGSVNVGEELDRRAIFNNPSPTGPDYKVHSRGYMLDATDDGVRITDPATNGKMTIPRDQIAAVIAGLNA